MGVRGKLSIVFLLLLAAAILAISAIEIDHVTRVMVDDLSDSGAMLIDQTFEQVRPIFARSGADFGRALGSDTALRAFLNSSQAFGRGVVYVRVEDGHGKILAAARPELEGQMAPAAPRFARLRELMSRWSPVTRARAVWGEHTYEMSRAVELDGEPRAAIKVGLSTGLIADEMRRSIGEITAIGGGAIVLCLMGVIFFSGRLIRPVRELASRMEQLALGRGDVHLRIGTHDELGHLAEKFNNLSQRIRYDRTQWENERGQLFNIFRSITDAVVLLDATGMVLFANAEAQAKLALPAAGAADGKPFGLLLGRDHPLARMVEMSYAIGSEAHDVALELGASESGERFLVSIFSLGRGPGPPGLLVILRDLKPVQELESVVDYSGRLARLGGLISGVAHQIRNPLNAMSLQLELLNQDSEAGGSIERRVQALRKEIRRLDQAVDALLRFMRPEHLKFDYVSLNELLTELAGQLAPTMVRVDYLLDPNMPRISADHALLSEALRNMMINAIESMPGGGTLTLGSATHGDGLVEVSIADEGQGIPPDHLGRIFQLYFTTKEGGNGLGLSLASRAIDLHGGTVEVKSTPGAGTTIKIRLPIVPDSISRLPTTANV